MNTPDPSKAPIPFENLFGEEGEKYKPKPPGWFVRGLINVATTVRSKIQVRFFKLFLFFKSPAGDFLKRILFIYCVLFTVLSHLFTIIWFWKYTLPFIIIGLYALELRFKKLNRAANSKKTKQ